jgi:hypothetical protein
MSRRQYVHDIRWLLKAACKAGISVTGCSVCYGVHINGKLCVDADDGYLQNHFPCGVPDVPLNLLGVLAANVTELDKFLCAAGWRCSIVEHLDPGSAAIS